jgi:hypothetical protein
MVKKNSFNIKKIVFYIFFLMAHELAQAQADSVASRLDYIDRRTTVNPSFSALTRGPTMNAWIGGLDANRSCTTARINRSGVILSVTVLGPEFGTTAAFTKADFNANWINGAVAVDSTTSQVFIPPGGMFCVATRGGMGTYFVTAFKLNATPEIDYPYISMWNDYFEGFLHSLVTYNDGPDTAPRTVCSQRTVYRRIYPAESNIPPAYVLDDLAGYWSSPINPVNGPCPD